MDKIVLRFHVGPAVPDDASALIVLALSKLSLSFSARPSVISVSALTLARSALAVSIGASEPFGIAIRMACYLP